MHKKKYFFIITLFTFISIVIIAIIYLPIGNKLELMIYDLLIESMAKPADSSIVIVDVDDKSIADAADKVDDGLGRYPWPRTAYTKIMRLISEGKPKAIVLDINFEGKTAYKEKEFSDKQFIEELKNIPNVFFLQKISTSGVHLKQSLKELFEENESVNKSEKDNNKMARKLYLDMLYNKGPKELLDKHYYKVEDNTLTDKDVQDRLNYYEMTKYLEGIYEYAERMAISNSFTDSDKTVRSYQPIYKYNTGYLFSMPLAINYFIRGEKEKVTLNPDSLIIGDKKISLNDKQRFYLNWRKRANSLTNKFAPFALLKNRSYISLSFIYLFYNNEYNIKPDIFKDKIVVIGSSSDILKDKAKIPGLADYYGVEVLATAIDNIINDNKFIIKMPLWANITVTLLLLLCGGLVYKLLKSKSSSLYAMIIYLIAIIILYIVLNGYVFTKMYVWIDMVLPVVVYLVSFTALITVTSIIERDKRSHVESIFSKYVSPQIYQSLISNYKNVSLEAERKELTILFSDIRGFTPFTEELYAEQVAVYLNEYFNEMVKVILKNDGTIDKFMGDAVMAFFGAPLADKDHAFKAVKTALEMKESLNLLNKKWSKRDKKTLDIGIGINSGSVLVGNFGSTELMDYTVIGDPVNLAARLESLNKQENTNILISAFTYQLVKDKVKVNIIGPRSVKGKSETVVVYEVIGLIEN